MFEKLEAYLEEIGHFLSGREEREEILVEIRSHILEKAEQEYGPATEASIAKVINAYGPARRVAEKYLDGREIIAPAYNRYLFRYTALVFAFHFVLTVVAVVFKKSFLMFPFLYVPSMGPFEALFYLPTAFLFDLGAVTLILHLITRSKKDVKLPWPKFSLDIDVVKPSGRTIGRIFEFAGLTALTGAALYVYIRYHTIFFVNFDFARHKPFFTPGAGQWFSLILIGLWAVSAIGLALKFAISSPWIDAVEKTLSLILIGLALRQPLDTALVSPLTGTLNRVFKLSLTITLLVICVFLGIDFVKALIRIGRKHIAK